MEAKKIISYTALAKQLISVYFLSYILCDLSDASVPRRNLAFYLTFRDHLCLNKMGRSVTGEMRSGTELIYRTLIIIYLVKNKGCFVYSEREYKNSLACLAINFFS